MLQAKTINEFVKSHLFKWTNRRNYVFVNYFWRQIALLSEKTTEYKILHDDDKGCSPKYKNG